ncbi:MAG: HPr-rel-A system PqqD family peptide chaperone [Gemmatimonadota bacterium]|nr:HPr-rel-A system PqqD family peptide chaperone [Gemmatimonadota bacterium]
MISLPRVRAGLLRHALDKQVLVYDPGTSLVHLLDPATACVMELLEEGATSADEIVSQIAIRLDVSRNPEFLPLALDELRKAGLLDLSAEAAPAPLVDVNRRDMIRKLALTGAAAMLVPAVATLTATPGYAQGSAQIGPGGACVGTSQCLAPSTICCNGFCAQTCSVGEGGTCPNGVSQCAPGLNCCAGSCQAAACGGSCPAGSANANGLSSGSLCEPNNRGACCSNYCDASPGSGPHTCR